MHPSLTESAETGLRKSRDTSTLQTTSYLLMVKSFSRLQKVNAVISALKQRFKSVYYPHSQLSIDEAMIPFKGQSSIKQYLPLKPAKRGFKVWAMADTLNGYLYDFNVYTGATGERNSIRGESSTYIVGAIEGEALSVL